MKVCIYCPLECAPSLERRCFDRQRSLARGAHRRAVFGANMRCEGAIALIRTLAASAMERHERCINNKMHSTVLTNKQKARSFAIGSLLVWTRQIGVGMPRLQMNGQAGLVRIRPSALRHRTLEKAFGVLLFDVRLQVNLGAKQQPCQNWCRLVSPRHCTLASTNVPHWSSQQRCSSVTLWSRAKCFCKRVVWLYDLAQPWRHT